VAPLDCGPFHASGDAGDVGDVVAECVENDVAHHDGADSPTLRFGYKSHGGGEAGADQNFG